MLDSLRPKTTTAAGVTLVATSCIVITYLIFTDAFLVASIYIGLLGALLVCLTIVTDLWFSSLKLLYNSYSRKTKEEAKSSMKDVTPSTVEPKAATNPHNNSLFNMGAMA